jgi:hypothetical protein
MLLVLSERAAYLHHDHDAFMQCTSDEFVFRVSCLPRLGNPLCFLVLSSACFDPATMVPPHVAFETDVDCVAVYL